MKPSFKQIDQKVMSGIGIIIIAVLIAIKIVDIDYYPDTDWYEGSYRLDESRLDSLNDELRTANHKKDSIAHAKTLYVDGPVSFSGFTSFVGVGALGDYGNNKNRQSYVVFGNLGLKINEALSKSHLSFHTIGRQGFLTKMRFEKTAEGTKATYMSNKVGYNYLSRDNRVLVKLNSLAGKILVYIFMISDCVFRLVLFFFVLKNFFNFLLAISKNQAFITSNVMRLQKIAVALFIFSVYPFLINGIIYAIFVINYPSEGIQLKYSFWTYDVYFCILAILSYIIYTAFKKAMILQRESELTI